MKHLIIFIAVLLSLNSHANAQNYSENINRVENLGKLMAEQDNAAWVTTDDFMKLSQQGKAIEGLAGWVSYKNGENYKTVFLAEQKDGTKAVYEALTQGRDIKSSTMLKAYRSLTTRETALWTARQTVLSDISSIEICPQFTPMNAITLPIPNDPDGHIYVYLMSASQTWGEIVLGKHYRFTISKDGKTILDTRSFTNSCFALKAPKMEKDQKPAAIFATHVNAPYPEEHHVFASLSHNFTAIHKGLSLFVGTSENDIWKIKDGQISRVEN